MCYKVYRFSKKSEVQERDITFIEGNDEKIFIDEDRIEMEERNIDLATKHRSKRKKKY